MNGGLFSHSSPPFRFDADPTGAGAQRDLLAARGDRLKRPRVEALVPRMTAALRGRGWVAASHLAAELNTDARALREAAHQSSGQILGHVRGYIATSEATLAEVHSVTRRLLSQSNRMRDRVRQIERVRHERGGGSGT